MSTLQYDSKAALDRFNEDCLLIRITSSLPGARRQCKSAAQDAAAANNADVDSVTASVVLFTNESIKPARDEVRQATDILKTKTVPWNNDGWRIIQTSVYQEVYPSLKNARANFYDARDQFVATYNEKIADAKRRLDFLFKADDFPSPRVIGESFAFEIETDAIKDARDIRIKGSVELVRQVEQEIMSRNKRKLEEAQQHVLDRLLNEVKSTVESLTNYNDKVDRGERTAFYDSAITGIKALCNAIPKLNITKDAKLSSLGKLVNRELGQFDPKQIKDSPETRQAAIKSGKSLLSKIEAIALDPIN